MLSYFVGYIDLVRCVLELRCGMAVVVWYPYAGWGTSASTCIRIPHHHSHTTTQHQHTSNQINVTHEITQHISRKLLRMDVLTSGTCWALYEEIIKQVTSSWSLFTQLSIDNFGCGHQRSEGWFSPAEYFVQQFNCMFFAQINTPRCWLTTLRPCFFHRSSAQREDD